MKVEAPFFVPFFTEKCPFFDEIKDDLISIIYDMHMKAPYETQGSSPSGKHIKDKLTSSDHNFFKIEKGVFGFNASPHLRLFFLIIFIKILGGNVKRDSVASI